MPLVPLATYEKRYRDRFNSKPGSLKGATTLGGSWMDPENGFLHLTEKHLMTPSQFSGQSEEKVAWTIVTRCVCWKPAN